MSDFLVRKAIGKDNLSLQSVVYDERKRLKKHLFEFSVSVIIIIGLNCQ